MKFKVIIYKKRKPEEEKEILIGKTTTGFKSITKCHDFYAMTYKGHEVSVEDITDSEKENTMQLKHYKPLIAEVLDIKEQITKIVRKGDMVYIDHEENEFTKDNMVNMNIHVIAFELKIWAYRKGYDIVEHKDRVRIDNMDNERVALFYGGTDIPFSISRVFEAGEWVRKTIEEKEMPDATQTN